MAERTLIITSGANTIMFGDLDNDKELQIEIENGYKEYNSVYLDKENLISLREHLDYIIKKHIPDARDSFLSPEEFLIAWEGKDDSTHPNIDIRDEWARRINQLKIYKALNKTDDISSYLCDSCGEKFTGKKHKIYDENFNECCGLIECDKCFSSRLDEK